MKISPLAGHPPPQAMLLDVAKLVAAYYAEIPDPSVPAQRVAFGTSGHRGSSFEKTFNEWHVLAISEAICRYRRQHGIGGRSFLASTRTPCLCRLAPPLSRCSRPTASTSCSPSTTHTPPTPAVSHAILSYKPRSAPRAEGGGWPTASWLRRRTIRRTTVASSTTPQRGTGDSSVTSWIEGRANELMERGLEGVKTHPIREGVARRDHAPARLSQRVRPRFGERDR